MKTETELLEENETLRALLQRVRPFFSWGAFLNDEGEEVGDASPGPSCRLVNRPLCEAIDAVVPPPWAE